MRHELLVAVAILAAAATPAAGQNLLVNPGFEDGNTNGWVAIGSSALIVKPFPVHGGSWTGMSTARGTFDSGPGQVVTGVVANGQSYNVSCWVRLANAPGATARLRFFQSDSAGARFLDMDQVPVTDQAWSELSWSFRLDVTGVLTQLVMIVDGPPAGVELYLDDCSLEAFDWEAEADARIESVRKRDVEITTLDDLGNPKPGASVDAQQTSHRFAFGAAMSDIFTPEDRQFFLDHFEWATFEGAAKWFFNEPTQGVLDYAAADAHRDFCNANGIKLHGHNVFWGAPINLQAWLVALDDTALQFAMEDRITDVVTRYENDFLIWDVNNEMLAYTFFQDRLGPGIRPWMFQQVRLVDPDVQLFVNEFSVVAGTGTYLYVNLIQNLIAQGAEINGIGAEGHWFNNRVDPADAYSRLDELATLGLPIRITEYDSVAPDENVRADNLERLYRAAFSHPAVEGITMWGYWADAHWLGPDAAIANSDWTLNAAGVRYETIIDSWTTQASGTTDGTGLYAFRGFMGAYDVTITDGPIETTYVLEIEPGTGASSHLLPCDPDGCILAGEVENLLADYTAGTDETTLTWSPPSAPAGMSVLYDVLSSVDPSDFGDPATCVAVDQTATTAVDVTPVGPGGVLFFLARAKNLCGLADGPLGFDSAGSPRTAGTCM